MKRGTARRGMSGWAKAMVQAKGQAERYAKALPVDHRWPPFLLVTDIGYCIEVYADFTGSGKAYAQFPDRSRYRIMLEDLRDPDAAHASPRSGPIRKASIPRHSRRASRARSPTCSPPYRTGWRHAAIWRRRSAAS